MSATSKTLQNNQDSILILRLLKLGLDFLTHQLYKFIHLFFSSSLRGIKKAGNRTSPSLVPTPQNNDIDTKRPFFKYLFQTTLDH
jgi:hypothetical protein